MINIIVAYSKSNRVIGKNGKIPWRISEDTGLFKSITESHAVIMGRKTWDSIPQKYRPLKNRHNIVVTKNPDPYIALPANSLLSGITIASQLSDLIYIIGGASVYQQSLDMGIIDTVLASEIHQTYNGDTFFPELDDNWKRTTIKEYNSFEFVIYNKLI